MSLFDNNLDFSDTLEDTEDNEIEEKSLASNSLVEIVELNPNLEIIDIIHTEAGNLEKILTEFDIIPLEAGVSVQGSVKVGTSAGIKTPAKTPAKTTSKAADPIPALGFAKTAGISQADMNILLKEIPFEIALGYATKFLPKDAPPVYNISHAELTKWIDGNKSAQAYYNANIRGKNRSDNYWPRMRDSWVARIRELSGRFKENGVPVVVKDFAKVSEAAIKERKASGSNAPIKQKFEPVKAPKAGAKHATVTKEIKETVKAKAKELKIPEATRPKMVVLARPKTQTTGAICGCADKFGRIKSLLDKADIQRSATSEHKRLMSKHDFRKQVLNRLAKIQARINNGENDSSIRIRTACGLP